MRAVQETTAQLIRDLAETGGGFDYVWVADLMYDGDRRIQGLKIEAPDLKWDGSRFVVASGSIRVVWADDFGSSMIPRQIGDWFSPFGAELQIDILISAGQYQDRIPMGRFVIRAVPDAEDRRMLFEGLSITPGESFTLELADRMAKVAQDEFPFPTRARSMSAWDEIQSVTGFPIIRSTPDAEVPPTIAYEGEKTPVVNQLSDLMDAWPFLTADGVLTAVPKEWGPPVDEIRGVVSAPISMTQEQTYNVVIVEGKAADGSPIYATADVAEGFLRVRNVDGGVSPFGQKPYRYSDNLGVLDTYDKCAAYAAQLLNRVSQIRGVTRTVVEPFNPLREPYDVLAFGGGVVRVQQVSHRGAETHLVVEVPDR
jgi:hypothetical protein